MDGRRIDADAVERGRLPKAVSPVECDGKVARMLQFGNERERQKFSTAEREAEIVVEKDFLHGQERQVRLRLVFAMWK